MSLPPGVRVIERGWLSSNNILLLDGDDATLVDSGYVGHAGQTVALVKSALAGRRLRRLINTHSHSDHIGGNAALQREFACRIAIPAGIEQHVAAWDEQALLLAQSAQRGERFRHDEVVADGDRLLMGGLAWRVHAAPGHDMDALVFHCPDARLLISGDALWEDGFGIVFGELLGAPGALAATRATLDRIARLPIDTVIPGHGAPFGDVEPALARAYRRLAAFEADPARLARNAIKGCFIFNLLDLESLPRVELAAYLERVPFFQDIGARWLGMDVDALAAWLVAELGRAGAIEMIDGRLRPTMAA
ncbi:MAG: MBL fold metallo-hydrolase [Rhodocyclaceae bacterium]|jgi:glyoxylase-like metal-dependent hydrolase (beta-lactamase superfamily II)|nr:MBL fold metallo-hydrolase [Rhodocyclaceae bacterium]